MISSTLLGLPKDVVVDQIHVLSHCLAISIRSTASSATCPLCSQSARHIHSRYLRAFADVPSGGRQVIFSWLVRKFFCQNDQCPRRVFAERLPDVVAPRARMTLRFDAALQAIGFASSGEAGARLATFLGMPTSPSTVLRRIKGTTFPSQQVTKIGIDDFAFRRGLKYGTILVDLETHRVVDLLPDRSVATATAWFKKHPEIRVISRDRGADYATAASQGSPQAVQVADRWHIVHNLSETLSLVLENYRTQLRSVSHVLVPPPIGEPEKHHQDEDVSERSSSPIPIASGQPYRAPFTQWVQQTRRESRLQRYQQIVELQRQGMTIAHIGQLVGLSSRTIRRWLTQKQVPQERQRRRRPSLIDPYELYVLVQWQQGCHNGLQIWREIAARGYSGSPKALYHYLARLRSVPDPSAEQSSTPASGKRKRQPASSVPSDPLLRRHAVSLLLRRSAELTALEQESLQHLRHLHPQIEVVYQLSQSFMSMVYQQHAESLDPWLVAVQGCGIAELERFGRGIEQEKAAVLAGLTLPYSNDHVA